MDLKQINNGNSFLAQVFSHGTMGRTDHSYLNTTTGSLSEVCGIIPWLLSIRTDFTSLLPEAKTYFPIFSILWQTKANVNERMVMDGYCVTHKTFKKLCEVILTAKFFTKKLYCELLKFLSYYYYRVPTFFIPSNSLIFPWFPKSFPWFFLSFHQDILVKKNPTYLFFLNVALVTLVYANITISWQLLRFNSLKKHFPQIYRFKSFENSLEKSSLILAENPCFSLIGKSLQNFPWFLWSVGTLYPTSARLEL